MSFEKLLFLIKMNCEETIRTFKKKCLANDKLNLSGKLFDETIPLEEKKSLRKRSREQTRSEEIITACWGLYNSVLALQDISQVIAFCQQLSTWIGEDDESELVELFNNCKNGIITLCIKSEFFSAIDNQILEKLRVEKIALTKEKKSRSINKNQEAIEEWVGFLEMFKRDGSTSQSANELVVENNLFTERPHPQTLPSTDNDPMQASHLVNSNKSDLVF